MIIHLVQICGWLGHGPRKGEIFPFSPWRAAAAPVDLLGSVPSDVVHSRLPGVLDPGLSSCSLPAHSPTLSLPSLALNRLALTSSPHIGSAGLTQTHPNKGLHQHRKASACPNSSLLCLISAWKCFMALAWWWTCARDLHWPTGVLDCVWDFSDPVPQLQYWHNTYQFYRIVVAVTSR